MANSSIQTLNATDHMPLRVVTDYGHQLGDGIGYAITYPIEFRDIQACYPILFSKDSNTGAFFPVALLGTRPDENLFLDNSTWNAPYIPATVRRHPFLISSPEDDRASTDLVILIDTAHPKVNAEAGQVLFDEAGAQTPFLKDAAALLNQIHSGLSHSKEFMTALLEHDLLEPITISFTLDDGTDCNLNQFYGIAEEQLFKLSGKVLEQLNQNGFLQPAYMAIASMSRLRTIIEAKNRQINEMAAPR